MAAAGAGARKVRLMLEWFMNPDHLPFLVALDKGWFADAGLDLELVEPKDHMDAFEEIKSGRVHMAITEPIHLVQDLAKGEKLVGFCRFLHCDGGVMYFPGDSGIRRPRDMAGKRLTYPGAPGPGGPAIVRTMIERDGGPKDAEIVPVHGGFEHTQTMLDGKADIATLVFHQFEVVEARHRGKKDAKCFSLKRWGVPDFCQLILVTTPEYAASEADTLRALVSVLRRAIDLVYHEPEEAREIYFRRSKDEDGELMRDIFDATVKCFTFDLSMSADYYKALAAWLVKTEQADGLSEEAIEGVWSNAVTLES